MSEKIHVVTDAPKPPLRGRVKSKLSALKPDKTTTLIALTGVVSMVASYVGTHAEIVGFTRSVNGQLQALSDAGNLLESTPSSEED